jgi:hypothetical protein
LVKSSRAYKSSKRSRELARQKKQEEKRLRRIARHEQPHAEGAGPELDMNPEETRDLEKETGPETEPGDESPEGGTPDDGTPPAV